VIKDHLAVVKFQLIDQLYAGVLRLDQLGERCLSVFD